MLDKLTIGLIVVAVISVIVLIVVLVLPRSSKDKNEPTVLEKLKNIEQKVPVGKSYPRKTDACGGGWSWNNKNYMCLENSTYIDSDAINKTFNINNASDWCQPPNAQQSVADALNDFYTKNKTFNCKN